MCSAVDGHPGHVGEAGSPSLDPSLADERVATAEDDEGRQRQLGDPLGRRVGEHRADEVEHRDRAVGEIVGDDELAHAGRLAQRIHDELREALGKGLVVEPTGG